MLYRMLQCLSVAVRPLRVEELAELLAFDFTASTRGEIPKLKVDWCWENQEEAILSTCSSIISILYDDTSPSRAILLLFGEGLPHVASSHASENETSRGFIFISSLHIRSRESVPGNPTLAGRRQWQRQQWYRRIPSRRICSSTRHASGMGWMICLTYPSPLGRGSGYTTWTKTGPTSPG
jgi:hypothetical protein